MRKEEKEVIVIMYITHRVSKLYYMYPQSSYHYYYKQKSLNVTTNLTLYILIYCLYILIRLLRYSYTVL